MATSNFHLRNMTANVMLLLKKKASEQKISINSLILQLIEQGMDIARPKRRPVFHDLDYLAGTWSSKDKKAFDETVKSFEKIDKELWS